MRTGQRSQVQIINVFGQLKNGNTVLKGQDSFKKKIELGSNSAEQLCRVL